LLIVEGSNAAQIIARIFGIFSLCEGPQSPWPWALQERLSSINQQNQIAPESSECQPAGMHETAK
jgi:hypothetical protein